MKILFVFNHPAPYKVRLFNELVKNSEIDLQVIFERKSASDRPTEFYNAKEMNFKYMFLKGGAFGKENSNTKELKNYIREHHKEYDLIIMNGYSQVSEMRAIKYMRKSNIPFVLYINGGVIKKESFIKRRIKTRYITSASKYLSPCEEASEYLYHYGVKKEDVFHYPYSTLYEGDVLKEPLTKEEKMAIRKKYQLPENKLFVTASQFIDRKNIEQTILSFKNRQETLLVIGNGPRKDKYLSLLEKNNIKNVIIMDFLNRNELLEVMKSADAFITLSKEDIYGHTTNEALGCGLPVISSKKVISSLHLINEGKNGFLVDLDNEKSIQNAINSVNTSMTKNALETARENTIEKSAKEHIRIFKELVKCV